MVLEKNRRKNVFFNLSHWLMRYGAQHAWIFFVASIMNLHAKIGKIDFLDLRFERRKKKERLCHLTHLLIWYELEKASKSCCHC